MPRRTTTTWGSNDAGLVQLTSAAVTDHRVGQPDVTALRTWGAHERISVKRAGRLEEDKR
jgi:predicted metal-dependent hydrolase